MEWVTVPDVRSETWRRIREFANEDMAIDAIAGRHGMPRSKSEERNYRKQARQIRLAIQQAGEYFDAARTSTPITSPNPLYYGMTSLTSAIMLLLGTGEHALDRLRRTATNRSHGLRFTTGVDERSSRLNLALLERSRAEVLQAGHFLNWYRTLASTQAVYAIVQRTRGESGYRAAAPRASQELVDAKELVSRRFSLLGLIDLLPDMRADLDRYRCRRTAASRAEFQMEETPEAQRFLMWIHGAGSPEDMEAILENFTFPHQLAARVECRLEERLTSGLVEVAIRTGESAEFTFPSIRETIDGVQVVYASHIETKEIADAYLLGYGLSMLARYYPDLWVACLESHCRASKVVERVVAVLLDKFPMLALSEMVGDKVVVSTHRPPWHA